MTARKGDTLVRNNDTVDRGFFAVGVLSVTAVVLLVGIMIAQMMPAAVHADGMSVTGGDYTMTVGAFVDTDEEYLYVIDIPSSKMAVYRFDIPHERIEIIQGIELSKLRTPTGEAVPIPDEDGDDSKDDDSEAPKTPTPEPTP
jgi:hypothetical protein